MKKKMPYRVRFWLIVVFIFTFPAMTMIPEYLISWSIAWERWPHKITLVKK